MILLVASALAQEPQAPQPLAPGDRVQADAAVALTRWPGGDPGWGELPASTPATVVFVEGDLVRVRYGSAFGWAPAASLRLAPPPALDLRGLEGLEGLTLPPGLGG